MYMYIFVCICIIVLVINILLNRSPKNLCCHWKKEERKENKKKIKSIN